MNVPFTPDARTLQAIYVESSAVLEPKADVASRNYLSDGQTKRRKCCGSAVETLSAPEMTVLVGGLRVLR